MSTCTLVGHPYQVLSLDCHEWLFVPHFSEAEVEQPSEVSGLIGANAQRFAMISFSVHRRSIASSPNCESGSVILWIFPLVWLGP